MTSKMIRQTMFNVGEVDIVTWKRRDVTEYLNSAQSLLNAEVGTTGLAKKRKGTSLLLNVTGFAQFNSHMYEFVDKNDNHYVVVSAAGFFYVFSAPTSENQVITNTGANVVTAYGTNVVVNSEALTFTQVVPMPYQTGDLDNIDYTQDNDALIFTHPNYAPGRLYISAYNGSLPPTFTFQYLNIYPLPAYDFNTINYNAFTVVLSVTSNILTFQFTGVGANPGFNNSWINGQIVGGGSSDINPVGYAIITAVSYSAGGGGVVTFTATVQIPFQTTGYATQGSQYSVKQPVWIGPTSQFPVVNPITSGYPAKVLFFQNRLWFGNTNVLNNTIFGSKINAPINFDVGTGRDTDAIVYTIGQTGSGSILWMNGGKQMEIFCENAEFACPQDQNTALTPSTFSIRQQSSYGASSILKPITYINDSYYATKPGKALVNFHFNGVGLTYTASNISVASSHLVKSPANRALLRGSDNSQDNFIYFINDIDNTLTSFQFATEYKLAALTPIEFQDNVDLIDIVTIANSIYILKFYTLTEQYTIELLDDTTRIDCTFNATMASNGVVTGLNSLNGYTVEVVFENQDFGQYLVVNNQITVNNPTAVSGGVEIGLLYDVAITPMYPYAGAQESPFKKQVQRIYVDYYQSLDFYVNGNLVPYQNFADIQLGLPLEPQTDTAIISPFYGWNRFDAEGEIPIITITQSSPFDLQITSIGYQVAAAVI